MSLSGSFPAVVYRKQLKLAWLLTHWDPDNNRGGITMSECIQQEGFERYLWKEQKKPWLVRDCCSKIDALAFRITIVVS